MGYTDFVGGMETKAPYVCTGGCGGGATEAEYNTGKTLCGTAGCPKQGQPFEKHVAVQIKGGWLSKLSGLFKK